MRHLLLDSLGWVLAMAADGDGASADLPDLLNGVAVGQPLLQRLAPQSDDADAMALHSGLQAVLSGRPAVELHLSRHRVTIARLVPAEPAMALLCIEPRTPAPRTAATAVAPAVAGPPAEHSPPAVLPAVQALRQRHGGDRVLLAEDDPVNQLAMLELLADAGLQVDLADDGRAAVDLAVRRRYGLALLDLHMPRLDGLGAARAIRVLPGLQRLPLIALSASGGPEQAEACLAAGMNAFLPKPVSLNVLYETLLHWLDAPSAAPAPVLPAPPPPAHDATRTPPPGVEPLLGLDGIDAAAGLACVGGKASVYRRLLELFVATHADDVSRLQRLLDAHDVSRATVLAHSVRGGAATLGLVDVETEAGELEHALQSGGRAAAAAGPCARFAQALETTLGKLRRALAT